MNKGTQLFKPNYRLEAGINLIEMYVYLNEFDATLYEVINPQGLVTVLPKTMFYANEVEAKQAYLQWVASSYNQLKDGWFPKVPEIKEEGKE